jgi:hypothetical protein
MKRLIKLFEEETGYLYPKSYLEWLQWHPKYHDWLQCKLNRLLNFEEDQKLCDECKTKKGNENN